MRINYFTLGFLLNAVLERVTDKVSNDYTLYVIGLFIGIALLTTLCEIAPRKKGTK